MNISELLEQNDMQTRQLFGFPIYKRKFQRHNELKNQTLKYFQDPKNFENYTSVERLLFTSSNLHKEPVFKPYADFFLESLKIVMTTLGYKPDIAFTGMWGTVHPDNGFHHRHTHFNSFLAGVYYFDGTPESSGTIFHRNDNLINIVVPAVENKEVYDRQRFFNQPFEEGTLIIFPAWLTHDTGHNNINNTKKYRKILSFNTMPVGPTNLDVFDRYNYADVSNEKNLMHDIFFGDPNFKPLDLKNHEYFKSVSESKEDLQNELKSIEKRIQEINSKLNNN